MLQLPHEIVFHGVSLVNGPYREQELAFRTQYAELKERTQMAGPLLAGTPGTLALRSGTGHGYWYRVFYPVPGKQSEQLVGKESDTVAENQMRERIAFAGWVAKQVSSLRMLGYQVVDKKTARVLVELHNRQAFDAGLVLVGTLAYMAWLNEFGAIAVAARTEDLDLARPVRLSLQLPFLETMAATGLPFSAVPGMPSQTPSTSVKLPGVQGLRVDVLAPGKKLGQTVNIPELDWSAQTVPYFDYLLHDPSPGAVLAGNHCIPVQLPQAARFVWHKLYSSTKRAGFREKAEKDLRQALTLAAVLVDTEDVLLRAAFEEAPAEMIASIRPIVPVLIKRVRESGAMREFLRECFGSD